MRKGVPITVLITALADPSALVREATITSLGKLGIYTSIELLITALKDEDASVRAAAAYALGKIGRDLPIGTLAEGLDDPDPLVREATATALGDLANIEARSLLLAHLQEEEALVLEAITQSLMRLETTLTQQFIHILINMEDTATQKIAQQAIKALMDLGLDIHEETACIAPLVVALQGTNKDVQKAVTTYLIGRTFDALSKKMALAPSIELLQQEQLNPVTLAGVWQTFSVLAISTRKERRKIQMLISALKDQDSTIRKEADEAIRWLIQIAKNLLEERSSRGVSEKILKNKDEKQRLIINHALIGQGIEALEERETLEPIFTDLCDTDVQKKGQAMLLLHKRAQKASMARMPSGTLNISLRNVPGSTPLALQFGPTEEQEPQDGRTIFPWCNPAPKAKEFIDPPNSLKIDPVNKNASNWT